MCDQSCLRSIDGKNYSANALHQTVSSKITSWVEYISGKASKKIAPEKPCETGGGSRDAFGGIDTDPKQKKLEPQKNLKTL